MSTSDLPQEENNDRFGSLVKDFADAVEEQDVEAEEAASLAVWQHISEMDHEPSPWLLAMNEATLCEAAFDWDGAEEAYKRACAVDNPRSQAKAYESLAAFYQLLGRDENILETLQRSTQLALIDPMAGMDVFAFLAESGIYLQLNDLPRAGQAIEEAFARLEDGPMHDLTRAYALIRRAGYEIRVEAWEAVQKDLEAAWSLLQPHADFFFAGGWQKALAFWWTITARLRAAQSDDWEAMKAWKEVVDRHRIIAQLPQLEGPYKHNNLAVALRDFGLSLRAVDSELAKDAFKESRMIRQSIGLPPLDES